MDRHSAILQFIHQYSSENGFVPSIREIGRAANITSTSVVSYNLARLVALGYLVKSPGKARAFALTHAARELFEEHPATDTCRLREETRLLKAENERLRRPGAANKRQVRRGALDNRRTQHKSSFRGSASKPPWIASGLSPL